ncbi:AAA family ATPase [Halopseudomonas salegens]|uniref:DamX protein n=1 Tax=Halopseudomonas salegens TaxID=1434072 RepID=A0A1H2E728_9GAMM|nr:AAA family ATPase [Halopseudomonas salegens]SDT90855.1 DamX protein [Halopseudomonas salegens]
MTVLTGVEDYLAHYQLAHDPFAPRTPGFKFFTPQRKPVLAELHHLARYGKQMLAVVAPEGGGKTLLRQALVASSNKDSVQAVVASAREYAETEALIGFFCQAVGAESRDATALMLRSEQLADTGMQLYLVIDDAELLGTDALQMLADLRAAGDQAPRIFLFADDGLVPTLEGLDSSEMPDELPAVHLTMLQPLSPDEVREYLHQRLEGAGQGIELLNDEQIASIVMKSGGWPGRINQAARDLMIQAAAPSVIHHRRKGSGPLIPRKSIIALVLVGLGVLLAWFMGGSEQEPTSTVLQLPESVPVVPAEVEETGSDRLQLDPSDRIELPPAVEPEVVTDERSWDPLPLSDTEERASVPPPVSSVDDQPEPVVDPEPTEPQVAENPAEAPQPTEQAQAVPEPVEPEPESSAVAATGPGIHGPEWYRQRQGNEFVLQLLGSRSEDAARAFIQRHSGLSDLGLFETRHQGQPWFVVTHGIYPNGRAARQAIAQLPEGLREQSPWARDISGIQQSLE